MLEKIILISGATAVGKSAVLKHCAAALSKQHISASIAKIGCLSTPDIPSLSQLGLPTLGATSQDICPDHYLVSNLCELWEWAESQQSQYLFIETAGLCNRCSPATQRMVAICVIDGTASCKAPQSLGPMLEQADMVVITKTDSISQAEAEILEYQLSQVNPGAPIFLVDALAGYGFEPLVAAIAAAPAQESFEGDSLRYAMPTGVCSYCVGECRVGSAFQQGIVSKIDVNRALNERCPHE